MPTSRNATLSEPYIELRSRSRRHSRATISIEERGRRNQPVGHGGNNVQSHLRKLLKLTLDICNRVGHRVPITGTSTVATTGTHMKEDSQQWLLSLTTKKESTSADRRHSRDFAPATVRTIHF